MPLGGCIWRCFVDTWLLHIFFFQAEDGIRDLTVTGVQTCALPIYFCDRAGPSVRRRTARYADEKHPQRNVLFGGGPSALRDRKNAGDEHTVFDEGKKRSEERRVGKECRSRWSPDHLKKK